MNIQEEPNVSCMITTNGLIQEFLGKFNTQNSLNEPPQGKPRGIFSDALYRCGGSFERKFIIPSGLIPFFGSFAC
jgi:hypothetical protein